MASGKKIARIEQHRVKTDETLASVGSSSGLSADELANFNFGRTDREGVTRHLDDDVGATRRDAGGTVVFDDHNEPGIILIPKTFSESGLMTDKTHTVRVRQVDHEKNFKKCVCIPGLTFEFDKSFIRPTIVDHMKKLDIALREFQDAKIIVFGHTDRVGGEQYNKELSERRAQSAYAFVTDKAEIWEQLYKQEDWGKPVLTQILTDLGFEADPGAGDPFVSAVKKYQAARGLKVDGIAGPITRQSMFKDYMTGKHDVHLTDAQFAPPKFMGCGEYNPLIEPNENELANGGRGRAPGNEPNRRVVFYLFRKPPTSIPCKLKVLAPCKTQIKLDPESRADRAPNPPFPCSFYDGMARECHCEKGIPPPVLRTSTPTFFTIEQPGATNFVRMHSLWAYMVFFFNDSPELEQVQRFKMIAGKLCDPATDQPVPIDCGREAFFYFSHRDDLLELDHQRFFARDRSGLPIIGPFTIPCEAPTDIHLSIWDQSDWAIVRGPRVFGSRPDGVKMAEWQEDYAIGRLLDLQAGGKGFFPHGDHREKERQERWKGNRGTANLVDLVHLGNPGNDPMWAGTLTALPSAKAKLILIHRVGSGLLHAGTYNEIEPTGDNQDFPGFHRFDQALVQQLEALPASDQGSAVDSLPAPPSRALLRGDICWNDQGQTNNCGAFSFANVMNYWEPYTSNPARMNGVTYARPGNVDDTINGARTPADIVNASRRFRMKARDNDAEEISRARGLKLVKLWIKAGVPVMVLVEEEYNVWSLHWKTIVGYDGNRIFYNNSGADDEVIRSRRTPGIEYEKAPVGNDVDSDTAFFNKWKSAGGDAVDLITSVDECTFIPMYPRDPMFAGSKPT